MNYLARFQIVEDRHVPGVPGEIVAEGVRFSNGFVTVLWLGEPLAAVYVDMIKLYKTHFDPSTMALHWIDPPPPGTPAVNDVSDQ